ncbi:DUF308 domain-containing protein [Klugiella xanthotipulae]|uniref:Uncharacterized membrane protein HdeD (DUF308 family) n=1 Tax=Klugiella xanthotipulae TaxID=244735 RepID=A0A543HXL1_9MICO|nr:DUF308 domain-containing protein [Klugiella xanthotipulae]TQM63108.1 uncharacterized membrane protein HdeD (DUF308 family) [Klugiella xanthotipulae]
MSDSAQQFAKTVRSGITALWWLYLLRGVFAVVFGIVALSNPGLAAGALAVLLGIYLMVEGLSLAISAVAQRSEIAGWGWLIGQGALTALAGLFMVILPMWTASLVGLFLVWSVVIWSVLAGIYGVAGSLRAKRSGLVWGWGMVASIMSILLSILVAVFVIADPVLAVKILVVIAGFWAILFGLILLFIAFSVRRGVKTLSDSLADAAADPNAPRRP